jgi:hypothetical protein
MQKPQESLDDFLLPIEPIAATAPPRVCLVPTGEVEVLKPLALDQPPANTGLLLRHRAPRISWFHRSLIFGGGALAAIGLIFLSAVFIAISEDPETAASDGMSDPAYTVDGEPLGGQAAGLMFGTVESSTSLIEPLATGELRHLQAVVSRPRVRTRNSRVDRITRKRTLSTRQAVDFVPTTLIIYAENGEIKTRIEPALTAAYKLPVSFSN